MNPHLGRSVSHNFLKGEVTLPCPDRSTCYIHYLTHDFFPTGKNESIQYTFTYSRRSRLARAWEFGNTCRR